MTCAAEDQDVADAASKLKSKAPLSVEIPNNDELGISEGLQSMPGSAASHAAVASIGFHEDAKGTETASGTPVGGMAAKQGGFPFSGLELYLNNKTGQIMQK